MALPASSTFTGSDGTSLNSIASWDGAGSDGNSNGLRIISNAAQGVTDARAHASWWTSDTFGNDHYSEATVVALASGTYIGVGVRLSGTDGSSNLTGYLFYSDSADGCYIDEYSAGAFVATIAGPGAVFATSDVIRLEASGSTLTGYVNGVQRLQVTDSSITSGAAGVCAFSNAGSRVDSWTADNLTGGALTVSVSDSLTITESVGRLLTSQRSVSDSLTLTESVNLTLVHNPSVSDSLTLAESVSMLLISQPVVSDSLTISESVTLQVETGVVVSDSVSVSESVAVAIEVTGELSVSVSDSISVAESVTLAVETSIGVSDSLTVSESISLMLVSLIAVSDSVTVTESVGRELTVGISVSDSLTVTESQVTLPIQGACIAGVLEASSNPNYFQNSSGIVVLTGFHNWYTLVDGGVADPPPTFDYATWLTFCATRGGNIFKLWTHETAQDWPDEANTTFVPLPWARTGPGNAADGKLKFDLDTWDQRYFDRLRQRAIRAGNAGFYVVVQLFQGWQADAKGLSPGTPVVYHPFADGNNINSVDGNPDDDADILEIRDTSNTAIYNRQKAYVEKVVNTLNDLDNVLFEISNEETATVTVTAWQHALVDYVHTYEAGLAKQHPVGMTWQWPSGDNEDDLYTSNADWISYGANDSTPLANPPAWPASGAEGKVDLWDTDHMGGLVLDLDYVWRAFCRGHNVLFMDSYDGTFGDDWTANATAEDIRYNLGYIQTFAADRLHLATATPQGSLSATGFCLANTTTSPHQYVAYQDTDGAFDLDVSNTAGVLTLDWLRVSDGDTQSGGTVNGGASRTLTPPWAGDAVVYLWQSTYAISVSDSLSLSESVSLTITSGTEISVSDSLTLSESVTVQVETALSVSDSLALSEVVVLEVPVNVTVSDSLTVSESVTTVVMLEIVVSDSLALSEAVSLTVSDPQVSVSDTLTLSESVTLEIVSFISVSDGVSLSESVTLEMPVAVAVSEALALAESVALTVSDPQISVSDSLTVAESVSLQIPLPGDTVEIAVSDSLSISELVTLVVVTMATPAGRIYSVFRQRRTYSVMRPSRIYSMRG